MCLATRLATLSRVRFASLAATRLPIRFLQSSRTSLSAEEATEPKIAMPTPEGKEKTDEDYPTKIVALVDQIEKLNLLEVADLNALLKSRLKISDAPVMMGGFAGAGAGAAPAAGQSEEEEEAAAPVAVQTSFTIKLNGFDAAKKVALIKELKAQVEGMNLVQAKKFVESAPAVIKADIGKDEAEALQKALEAVGAQCAIE